MEPYERGKKTVSIGMGLWLFTLVAFGLCHAPEIFYRLVDMVLRRLLREPCLVYPDNVIVIEKTFDDYLTNLQGVFKRI